MKKEKYICDNCKDEVENGFIHIKSGLIRRSNGKSIGRSIGIHEDELSEKTFCSLNCFKDYMDNILQDSAFTKNDYYLPGEQVGIDSLQGKIGK